MKLRLVILAILLLALPLMGQAPYTSVECKKFAREEGVELSPDFPNFLNAALKARLQKAKLFKEIISEGEIVDSSKEATSITIDGTLLAFKKGSAIKESLIGFGAGRRSLKAKVIVKRRSNQEVLYNQELEVKTSSRMKEDLLARSMANKIVGELKSGLKLK